MLASSITRPSLWTSSPFSNRICSVSAAACCTTKWPGTWHISSLLMNVFVAPVSNKPETSRPLNEITKYYRLLLAFRSMLITSDGARSVFLLSDIRIVRGTYRGIKVTKVTFLHLRTILHVMACLAAIVAMYLRYISSRFILWLHMA